MDSRSSNPCVQGPTVFLKITYFQISNLDGTGTTTYKKKRDAKEISNKSRLCHKQYEFKGINTQLKLRNFII